MEIIGRHEAKERWPETSEGWFYAKSGDQICAFNFEHVQHLVAQMTKEQQQELYEHLNHLGRRINR